MDIVTSTSHLEADAHDAEQASSVKPELRRIKGKSKVWEKVTRFARRTRRYSLPEGACVPEDDAAALPQSADCMDYDLNPFQLPAQSPAWFESSSSSDGEATDSHLGMCVKKSRLYPNSEIVEQSCLRPSIARALFQQMEAASSGSGRPTKYGWQKKKRRTHHSARCADHVTGLMFDDVRSTLMPVDCTASVPRPRHKATNCIVDIDKKLLPDQLPRHTSCTMKQWFAEFSDEQKNLVLRDFLTECDVPQIHLLSLEMEPRLHHGCPPNCCDRFSWLPHNVSLQILSFLDPVSLCRASSVCRSWHELVDDPSLWRRLCSLTKWKLARSIEQKQFIQHMMPGGSINWKKVFSERFRLRNNWLRGKCNVRTFEGHTQGISCVQFDDTRIVSGSSDKTIKVWNIRTNSPWSVQTLVGHSGTVRCLYLEGNRLVSGSTDTTIKVWDLSTQQSWSSIACKVTMTGHLDTVRCLQVDDEKVISGSYDKTLKVWDIRTGICRMTLRGHEAAVLCLQFDHFKIVSGSCDKTIKLWTFAGDCVMTLTGHQDAVTCLQFDDTRIVSGSLDCTIKFWTIATGRCVKTIDWKASEGHTGVVRCLQSDSWRVVSASDDKTLKVWSLETGKRLVTLRNHTDGVTCLQFNDSLIVSGSYDTTVKLWDFSCC
ncbi:hypothetical protein NP493_26g03018 [Ridgeia piscesae]|uniref:F-box domain-containing protein n=1 Tax=Ridgeia piscesae TaxID=27915 RepID=A0AAD9PD93_RIDPI|nr:hypothetical protein NP493_26g03018 [Ridgeia piscesae]